MNRGFRRLSSRTAAGALVLVAALSVWQASAPAPAEAVQSDLSYISSSTWTADPVAGRVHVAVVVTATSNTVDAGGRRYFYDKIELTLPAYSTGFAALSSAGKALPVTVESGEHGRRDRGCRLRRAALLGPEDDLQRQVRPRGQRRLHGPRLPPRPEADVLPGISLRQPGRPREHGHGRLPRRLHRAGGAGQPDPVGLRVGRGRLLVRRHRQFDAAGGLVHGRSARPAERLPGSLRDHRAAGRNPALLGRRRRLGRRGRERPARGLPDIARDDRPGRPDIHRDHYRGGLKPGPGIRRFVRPRDRPGSHFVLRRSVRDPS